MKKNLMKKSGNTLNRPLPEHLSTRLKNLLSITMLCFIFVGSLHAQKQIERLNRGIFALNKGDGTAYISWRLLVNDNSNVGFNIYRSTGGGAASKLNNYVITATTDYVDATVDMTKSNSYYVVPVVSGVEQENSEIFTLPANPAAQQYMPVSLQSINGKNYTDYNVLHVYPGDFDGDGDYDYIVKRMPVDASYNTILLDCYDNEGNFNWRIDLGPNVETYISSMTSPVLVADFDSDGKAEIIAKTGEQTVFANGYTIGDTNGDGKTDYNSHAGSGSMANIFEGPEFISLIDGETGAEIDRDNFINRGNTSDWGDNYGARVNFIMSSVGYFDGVHPGAMFSRGEGSHMVVEAWQVQNNALVQIWNYTSVGKSYSVGGWTDFHQIQCIDVDGDGKDETSWGACMLDHDGSLLYTTKYVHGDRFQITDINPNRAGLEVFIVQQNNSSLIGSALYDAATGSTIKDWYLSEVGDIGRGDAADVDPNSPGIEMFDTGSAHLHASDGSEVVYNARPYPWVSIWWDGDLLRESFIGVGSGGYNPAINKWNSSTASFDRFFTMYSDGGSYVLTCPYGGRAPLIADIFGDWREEIALETSDRTELRIYTTKKSAENRIYTLMQNPTYRVGVTTKAYLCSKYPDYFLGAGMNTPPTPNVTIVDKNHGAITVKAVGANSQVNLSWTASLIASNYEIMRDTDSDPVGRTRIAIIGSSVASYTDTDVTNGTTYYYWLKATDNYGNTVNSTVTSATPQAFAITSGETYVITARHSGLVLDVARRSTSNGANVLTWNYSGATNQQWIVTDLKTGYYSLKPLHATSLGLDVYNGSSEAGANIQVWSYGGETNQQFKLSAVGDGYYNIIARNSGMCLDVESGSTTPGANVQQWGCGSGTHQQFLFEKASLKSATISTDILDNEEPILGLVLSPNPNDSGKLNVKAGIQKGDEVKILIYSASGQLVIKKSFITVDSHIFESTIDISNLSSGIYFVTLKSGNNIKNKKLIIR